MNLSSRPKVSLLLAAMTSFVGSATAGPTVLPTPGQPTKSGTPGTFEVVGDGGVSAMQLFLGQDNRVYFVDKVENNPTQINGHPVWGSGVFHLITLATSTLC